MPYLDDEGYNRLVENLETHLVPKTRKVNGLELSEDINIDASEILMDKTAGTPVTVKEAIESGGGSGTVKSVNAVDPDENGNIALTADDIPMAGGGSGSVGESIEALDTIVAEHTASIGALDTIVAEHADTLKATGPGQVLISSEPSPGIYVPQFASMADIAALSHTGMNINGGLSVWQRGTSFTNPADQYTVDRMLCNGTGTIMRHASGRGMVITGTMRLRHIVDAVDYAFINGRTVTLSYMVDGQIVRSTYTATSAVIIDITLSNCTLEWVKIDIGEYATPYIPRPLGLELMLCQRYYEKSVPVDVAPYTTRPDMASAEDRTRPYAGMVGYNIELRTEYKVTKRVPPTVQVYSIFNGAVMDRITASKVNGLGYDQSLPISAKATSERQLQVFLPPLTSVAAPDPKLAYSWTADAEIY